MQTHRIPQTYYLGSPLFPQLPGPRMRACRVPQGDCGGPSASSQRWPCRFSKSLFWCLSERVPSPHQPCRGAFRDRTVDPRPTRVARTPSAANDDRRPRPRSRSGIATNGARTLLLGAPGRTRSKDAMTACPRPVFFPETLALGFHSPPGQQG